MSGYRGGYFVCPFYSRDYKDYLLVLEHINSNM